MTHDHCDLDSVTESAAVYFTMNQLDITFTADRF